MTDQENMHAHIAEQYNSLEQARLFSDEVASVFHEVNMNVWLETLHTFLGKGVVQETVSL